MLRYLINILTDIVNIILFMKIRFFPSLELVFYSKSWRCLILVTYCKGKICFTTFFVDKLTISLNQTVFCFLRRVHSLPPKTHSVMLRRKARHLEAKITSWKRENLSDAPIVKLFGGEVFVKLFFLGKTKCDFVWQKSSVNNILFE